MKKTSPSSMKNTPSQKIRLIGGDLKRSQIPVPDVPSLRPTPDRVRETLFNWLHHLWQGQFSDKSVLDLFAGSGALGFEAASRGVAHVQLVEIHPKALTHLKNTRDKLKLDKVRIHSHDALQALHRMQGSHFDLVFLDPPFHTDLLEKVIPLLAPILKPNGLVYIEAEKTPLLPPTFSRLREAKAGMVFYHLFEYLPDTRNLVASPDESL